MDPSYISSGDEGDAMAKAMGFSSFGTQGPTKKRKFNLQTDAIVDGQELASIDKGGKKGQGSGGNMIPLGKPRLFGVPEVKNTNEIDLEGEVDGDEGPTYIDTSLPAPVEAEAHQLFEGPIHLDGSVSPSDNNAKAMQERIDTIIAETNVTTLNSKAKANLHVTDANRGISQLANSSQHVPSNKATSHNAGSSVLGSQRPPQRGQKNEFWYVGYYDPTFNENPWGKLEMANGLPSKGKWVERERRSI